MSMIILSALFGAYVHNTEPAVEAVEPIQVAAVTASSASTTLEQPALVAATPLQAYAVPVLNGSLWDLHPKDVRLDIALKRWADKEGYSFRWDADRYVLISAETVVTGTFESAVRTVLRSPGIRLSDYPLEACIYSNVPPLLRITRLGDQTKECQQ